MSEMVKNIYFNEFLNLISHQLQTTPTKIVFKFHYKSMNTFLHSDTLGVSQSKFARNYEWNQGKTANQVFKGPIACNINIQGVRKIFSQNISILML